MNTKKLNVLMVSKNLLIDNCLITAHQHKAVIIVPINSSISRYICQECDINLNLAIYVNIFIEIEIGPICCEHICITIIGL